MSPSRGRQGLAQRGRATRRQTRGAGPPPRRGVPPLLWAAILVILLGVAAVVLAGLDPDRSDQSQRPGRRESGAVTVRGDALPPLPRDGAATDPAVGRPAPALSGADFDGRPVVSAAGGGGRVLIFLAHWCPHCRDEVPLISSWLEREGPPTGVALTSVSTGVDRNRPNYPPSSWLRRERWPLPVLADDPSGTAAKAYGLTGFPFFVFVDADGAVAGRHAGSLGIEELRARIEALRASRPAQASTTAAAGGG